MESKPKKVLLVEDEVKLAAVLAEYIQASGFEVQTRHDGTGIVEEVKHSPPDLILLDLMLPGKDGIDICREIRGFSEVPIIMVTARVEEIDRLLGLELGADDYICKPYSPREVLARVKALLRRSTWTSRQQPETSAISLGLRLDTDRFQAYLNETLLDLTPVEFRLLQTLAANPGRVFARDQLMSKIYSDQRVVTDRTVDTHIKNLRKKMEPHLSGDELIKSVYGIGYKLDTTPQ